MKDSRSTYSCLLHQVRSDTGSLTQYPVPEGSWSRGVGVVVDSVRILQREVLDQTFSVNTSHTFETGLRRCLRRGDTKVPVQRDRPRGDQRERGFVVGWGMGKCRNTVRGASGA